MRSRVTVVCLSVCYRSNCSSVDPCCPSVVIQNRHDTSKVFDSSILLKVLCSKVMASFTSSIGTAIYKVLVVVYSYPNDDTETATFDLTVLWYYYSDGHVDDQKLSCPHEPVSVCYWLNEENPEVTCDPWLASYNRYWSSI